MFGCGHTRHSAFEQAMYKALVDSEVRFGVTRLVIRRKAHAHLGESSRQHEGQLYPNVCAESLLFKACSSVQNHKKIFGSRVGQIDVRAQTYRNLEN
mmetsp:Transcript_1176/g.2873  ORF Transcript_1176/g.2873 Transcript_1176/m.2873 type:complete len:97 (-) Transcript_1176:81-371(-)